MPHLTMLAVAVALVSTFLAAETSAFPASASDDSQSYEQWIRDLDNEDPAKRDTARQQLTIAAAIPTLVQAIRHSHGQCVATAADILVELLDAPDAETADQSDAALSELENSPESEVRQRIAAPLLNREERVLSDLQTLGANASRSERGYRVIIHDGWKGGDRGLQMLERLRRPIALTVVLELVPGVLELGWIDLSRPKVFLVAPDAVRMTFEGLLVLRNIRHLESVSLTMRASDKDLVLLAGIPQLRTLRVVFPPDATGAELVHISKLLSIEELHLCDTPPLGMHLASLQALPALKTLNIACAKHSGVSGLNCLSQFRELKSLTLTHVPDLNSILPGLAELPHLTHLTLLGRELTDVELAHVGTLPALEELSLYDTAVSDDGLAQLCALPNLHSLRLPWTTITDDAIPHLQRMPGLRSLDIDRSFLSREGATELRRHRPTLVVTGTLLDPPPTTAHRQAVRTIVRMGGSVWMVPPMNGGISDALCRTHVFLGDRWHGTEDALTLLTKLDGLDTLDARTDLTDSAADHLRNLVELRTIVLRDTKLTDRGLSFVRNLPNLQQVAIIGPFTDAAVEHVSNTTALECFARDTKISEKGRKAIDQALQRNVNATKRLQEQNELNLRRSLVALACTDLPTDQARLEKARSDRHSARQKLFDWDAEVIPVLTEFVLSETGPQRREALLLLHECYTYYSTHGLVDPSWGRDCREVVSAFDTLWSWEESANLDYSDEERALILIGKCGGRVSVPNETHGGYQVEFYADWSGHDEDLACLTNLRPLTSLATHDAALSPRALMIVGKLTELQSLRIGVLAPTVTSLEPLRDLRALTILEITSPVEVESLRVLKGMTNLQYVHVRGLNDAGLEHIGTLPALEQLRIDRSPQFVGTGLAHLTNAKQLQRLEICGAPNFAGVGLESLAHAPKFSDLELRDVGVLGPHLRHLEQIASLTRLSLHATPVTHEGMQHIGKAAQLRELSICQSTVLDEDLEPLARLPSLTSLALEGNAITDEGVTFLLPSSSLQFVRVESTLVTDFGYHPLSVAIAARQGQPPPLARSEPRTKQRTFSPEQIATLKQLVAHGVCIESFPQGCRATIFPHWSGGDAGLASLKHLDQVKAIVVRTPLTDTALPYLQTLAHLQYLELRGTRFSEAGITKLRQALPETKLTITEQAYDE